MAAQNANAISEIFVVRRYHAAVAAATQIFRREKTEARKMSDGSGALSVQFGAYCLRRILDQIQVAARSDSTNRRHVGHLAEQMNRNDRACAR